MGAAARRERRLRAWRRHERLTVAMELATALHSAERPWPVVDVSPVTRSERMLDAWPPQEGLERAICPRSGAPRVSPVVMVQEAAHDDWTVAFLLAQSLLERQEQRKAQEVAGQAVPLFAWWTAHQDRQGPLLVRVSRRTWTDSMRHSPYKPSVLHSGLGPRRRHRLRKNGVSALQLPVRPKF